MVTLIRWTFISTLKAKALRILFLLLLDTLKYLNTSTYEEVKIQIKYRNGSIEIEFRLFITFRYLVLNTFPIYSKNKTLYSPHI